MFGVVGPATGQEPVKAGNPAALLEEMKGVQAALARLQTEIKQLREDIKAAEVRHEEATVKYAKSFAGTFLDCAIKGKHGDVGDMLAKSLTGKDKRLADYIAREQYAAQLHTAGKGHDGAEWKSWSIDSEMLAPNCKAMILKGKFKGSYEKKELVSAFVLHLVLEPDSGQWRVELYSVD
jgi:hypothetical protein